jgi:hypothetical protein
VPATLRAISVCGWAEVICTASPMVFSPNKVACG